MGLFSPAPEVFYWPALPEARHPSDGSTSNTNGGQVMKETHAALVLVSVLSAPLAAKPITTSSLVSEMIDLERVTRMPAPFFHTVQFSSYDHRSTLPGGPEWF